MKVFIFFILVIVAFICLPLAFLHWWSAKEAERLLARKRLNDARLRARVRGR